MGTYPMNLPICITFIDQGSLIPILQWSTCQNIKLMWREEKFIIYQYFFLEEKSGGKEKLLPIFFLLSFFHNEKEKEIELLMPDPTQSYVPTWLRGSCSTLHSCSVGFLLRNTFFRGATVTGHPSFPPFHVRPVAGTH